jgi:ribose 5-phosphate isomerase B
MLAVGCDHGGYDLLVKIKEFLDQKGIAYKDFGTFDGAPVDYPDIALPVAKSVASGECEKGILVCGTGIGMSLAANKVKGIRAAVLSDHYSCKYTRLHNDSNILCLGGRVIGDALALELVDLFLTTEFEGGRHARRIEKIAEIEK